MKKNEKQLKLIEKQSVQQADSKIWKKERVKRLTSSIFGKVISRRPNNVSNSLVKNMLYSKFKGNMHTIRGLSQENSTIIEYKNQKTNVEVRETWI